MAKQVKQFRYYSEPSYKLNMNNPSNIKLDNLVSGEIFSLYTPIYKIGIQALPGTKFYFNDTSSPIIIGHTGIFEMDLNEHTEIIALKFDAKSIVAIQNNPNAYLIVDIIYEEENT